MKKEIVRKGMKEMNGKKKGRGRRRRREGEGKEKGRDSSDPTPQIDSTSCFVFCYLFTPSSSSYPILSTPFLIPSFLLFLIPSFLLRSFFLIPTSFLHFFARLLTPHSSLGLAEEERIKMSRQLFLPPLVLLHLV